MFHIHMCTVKFKLTCLYLVQIHKELEELRERNKSLEEIAGQAEYFASLYQVQKEQFILFYIYNYSFIAEIANLL